MTETAPPTIRIRPANASDAPFVCDKLAATFTEQSPEDWKALFRRAWESDAPDFGTVAELNGRIVAFLGALYSTRVIGNATYRLCNLTSWWVDPGTRGSGVGQRLVEAYLEARQDQVITLLTLPASMMGFWHRQGIAPMQRERRVHVARVWSPFGGGRALRSVPVDEALPLLDEVTQRVVRDHRSLRCQVHTFRVGAEALAVITRRRIVQVPLPKPYAPFAARIRPEPGRGAASRVRLMIDRVRDLASGTLPCAEICYVSNPALLAQSFGRVSRELCRAQRALGIVGDSAVIRIGGGQILPVEYWLISRSPTPAVVDPLYTELFVLPLGEDSRG